MSDAALHRALSRDLPPSPPGALSASLTLGRRALLKIRHVPFQLFDVTVFPITMALTAAGDRAA